MCPLNTYISYIEYKGRKKKVECKNTLHKKQISSL